MRKKIQKVMIMMFIFAITTSSVISLQSTNVQAANEEKITIIHTNDVHSHVEIEPYVKGYADNLRAAGENVAIISAGDAFAGTPFASLSDGLDVAKVMNAVGYEIMTLGNHEYAMHYDVLKNIVAASDFPILAANAEPALRKAIPDVGEYLIKEYHGVKVAFLGLTTSYGDPVAHGKDTVATAERLKKEAEAKGASIFIAVTHLGVTDPTEEIRSTYLAEQCGWLTAIIDGHCHTSHPTGMEKNGVLIAETGSNGANIGIMEITLENNTVKSVTSTVKSLDDLKAEGIVPDTHVQKIITDVNEKNAAYLSEVMFTTPVTLVGNRAVIRKQETNFGNAVAEAYRLAGNADVGFAAAVTIRQDLEKGPVTREELLKSLGSEQRLLSFNYTGAQIVGVMEAALSTYPEETNSFQHISGMKVQFDPTKEAGSRVYKITMDDGSTLDVEKTYTVIAREDMLMQFLSDEEQAVTTFSAHGYVYPTFIDYANSGDVFKEDIANRLEVVDMDALKEEENKKPIVDEKEAEKTPDKEATTPATKQPSPTTGDYNAGVSLLLLCFVSMIGIIKYRKANT